LKLQIANDTGSITEYEFDSDIVTVGRNAENTIQLVERNVSRKHLRLVRENGTTYLEDAGSSFGLRLNGNRVSERTKILPGDRVGIGDFILRMAPGPGEITAEIEVPVSETQGSPIPGGVKGHLVVMSGPDEGSAYPLDRTSMMIGTAEHNAIAISGKGIAEVHAEIRWTDEGFEIEEMNGDVVVNALLVETALLSSADVIEMGQVQFSLRLPVDPEENADLLETRPSMEWDPQTAPTIQGDASMVPGATDTTRWWLIPLLAIVTVGTIAVSLYTPEERNLTALQAEVTGVQPNGRPLPPKAPEPPAVKEEGVESLLKEDKEVSPEENLDLLRMDAKDAMNKRAWDNAITLYQAILEKDATDEESKKNLAFSEMEERREKHVNLLGEKIAKGAYVQAWESIRKGTVTVPEESAYFAVFQKYRGDIEKETLAQLLSSGKSALKKDMFKAALKVGKDAKSIDSDNEEAAAIISEARRALTEIRREQRKKKKAAAAEKKANEPKVWKILYDEGRLAKRNGNNALAITKFKESLSVKNTGNANKMLGILYAVQGNKARAIQYYKEYLRLSPKAKDAETVKTVIKKLGGQP